MADEPERDNESGADIGDDDAGISVELQEEELPELYLSDGECWFPDAYQLCEQHGIKGLSNEGGIVMALVEGKGALKLSEVLKQATKGKGRLTAIRGDK